MFRRPTTNDAAVSRRSSLVAALAPATRCCDQPAYPLEIDRVLTAPTLLDARTDDHAVGDLHESTDIALIVAAADQQWAIAGQRLGLAHLADVGCVAGHAPRDDQRVGTEEARPLDMRCQIDAGEAH